MIQETEFIGCYNLPESMSGRFDQPWNFVGEVKTNQRSMVCLCGKCNKPEANYLTPDDLLKDAPFVTVDMEGHLFVTDDMIEVMVYFGVCDKCDSVYWARSGPPFRRARSYVMA